MSESKTSVRRLLAVEKQQQALKMRLAGVTLSEIAGNLGYKHASGALAAIRTALKNTIQQPADELRTVQRERLMRLLLAVWRRATGYADPASKAEIPPDPDAFDRALRVMKQLSDLDALNRPTTTRLGSDPDTPFPAVSLEAVVAAALRLEQQEKQAHADVATDTGGDAPDPRDPALPL